MVEFVNMEKKLTPLQTQNRIIYLANLKNRSDVFLIISQIFLVGIILSETNFKLMLSVILYSIWNFGYLKLIFKFIKLQKEINFD